MSPAEYSELTQAKERAVDITLDLLKADFRKLQP